MTSISPSEVEEVTSCSAEKTVRPELTGRRVGMVVFSPYPADPRPRRAAEALIGLGMQVDYICEGDESAPKREVIGALRINRAPITHWRGGKLSYFYQYFSFIFYSSFVLALRSLGHRYDLIYIHNMPDVLVFSSLLPKLLGAKVILDQHDPMPELMTTIFNLEESSLSVRITKWLEKWSIARVHLVITVNVACRRIFSQRSCKLEKIGVVMNSPDENIFKYRAANSYPIRQLGNGKPFVIMYHGSLVERNGLDLAVDAVARIRESIPSAQLRIYGKRSAFLDSVMQKVQQLGLEEHVLYMGPKRLEDLVSEIQACDIGVIPNQRNAFTDINTPTRIFEYLALGRPVIAPRTLGIQDYFDQHSLFFFDSGNAQELAQQIQFVYSHPREVLSVAERGQQVYLSHTWRKERETLINLVGGLLGEK